MPAPQSLIAALSLALAYLLGSLSPAYILGRLLKGIDIRRHGTRNAGTTNVYHVLGLGPAVVTAVFDLAKGLGSMAIAWALGAPVAVIHIAGLVAVLGHVFPFYLGFRGGQGVATAVAILIYEFALFLVQGWLSLITLGVLAFVVLSFFFITRQGSIVGLIVLPLLAVMVLIGSPFSWDKVSLLILIGYILFIDVLNISRENRWRALAAKLGNEIPWRIYLRPLALVFVLYYWLTSLKAALTFVGIVVLVFLAMDLTRLLALRPEKRLTRMLEPAHARIFKKRERRTLSSMTVFLISFFLTVLLFEKATATFACAYLVFGDMFSKSFGLAFGRRKIFEKTFEGSLAHFNACLIAGLVLLQFVPFSRLIALLGAGVASAAECLPLAVDDNLTVPILSAAAMSVPALF
jgi:glycerol-3-phosphate acyltransferase PlsY